MTKPELKPCPFCGGKPTLVSENAFEDGTVWQIYCSNGDCPVQPATTGSFFQDETLSDWNTRASTLPAQVADDAVEAVHIALAKSHYITDFHIGAASDLIERLTAQGYTLRRETRAGTQGVSGSEATTQASLDATSVAMTEAELEREVK